MTTLPYVGASTQEIIVGEIYYFGQLWNGDGEELLESGAISPDNENVVFFDLVDPNKNILDVLIKARGMA